MPPPPETLVIGYGNDLRGDDGAGVRAASLVAARRSPRSGVIATQQLTPDLAEDIAAAARVVFVDAYPADEDGSPLRVERIRVDGADHAGALGHHGRPAELMQLADRLFGRAVEAWVVGIPAFNFEAGERISPETQLRIDEAAELIVGDVFAGN